MAVVKFPSEYMRLGSMTLRVADLSADDNTRVINSVNVCLWLKTT